jgi:hypothetical protein
MFQSFSDGIQFIELALTPVRFPQEQLLGLLTRHPGVFLVPSQADELFSHRVFPKEPSIAAGHVPKQSIHDANAMWL